MNFYDSFYYLENHIIFDNKFQKCLDIEIVKVNPKTNIIDNDSSLNTEHMFYINIIPHSQLSR